MTKLSLTAICCSLLVGCQLTDTENQGSGSFDGFEESANHPALEASSSNNSNTEKTENKQIAKTSAVYSDTEQKKPEPNSMVSDNENQLSTENVEVASTKSDSSFEGFEESANHPALSFPRKTEYSSGSASMQNAQAVKKAAVHKTAATFQAPEPREISEPSQLVILSDASTQQLNTLLSGEEDDAPHAFIYQNSQLFAIRMGKYKAYYRTVKNRQGGTLVHNPPLLYNLSTDPNEQHNIASSSESVVKKMAQLKQQHQQRLTNLSIN